ncbi:hypothetical protein [Streptomyces nigrescens]|uniref:hypothetical protein n=1 Tax=Streptomyces nigrescens TaxID=1920 RepID=UPI0036FDDD59
MVETVLQIITQMASGTAAAAGTGMGEAISAMVRDRLAGTDRGSAALRAVEDQPGDRAAVDELRALLQAEVDADPGFAERIAATLAALETAEPSRTTTNSITFEGTTVRGRNTISLGPVTVSNTRNVRLTLLAAALVFIALVALGIYGGVRLIVGDDPAHSPTATNSNQPGSRADNPPKETAKATPESAAGSTPTKPSGDMKDAILIKSDVPEHWVENGWANYPQHLPCDAREGSLPGSSGVSNSFGSGPEGMGASIQMHSDPAEAKQALAWQRTNEEQCLHGRSVAVTPRGNETVGYQYTKHSVVYIRDGKYLLEVTTSGDLPHGLTGYFSRKLYERFSKVMH